MQSDLQTVRLPSPKLVIQLDKILKEHYPGKKFWGIIAKIQKKTGLSRGQIAAMRKNETKTISLEALQKIVSFLNAECGIATEELLGSFFGVEPSGFWGMFDDMTHVQICEGVRIDRTTTEPRWVNAYDAYLSATFIRQCLASSGRPQRDLEQCLIQAYSDEQHTAAVFNSAKSFYRQFREGSGKRALVGIGSMKSLPMFECVVADAFGAEPFAPQPKTRRLPQRPVPLYFRYRENDPDIKSVFGGRELPLRGASGRAGIAYEVDVDRWEFCPVSDTEDVAVVFYVCRPTEGTVELALAGFSGRATGCIALGLPSLAHQLWPPNYSRSDRKIGLFVIRYTFAPPSLSEPHSILVEPATTEVIAMPESVLIRRLDGVVSPPAPSSQSPNGRKPRKPR
ncbi:MAG: helix-turn-helix transcriptional regulator [Thermoguttaceae bacterium]|nr:helix-turn-helix transcriptional regulator [Thermoguttaceae bacterium]